MATRQKEPEFVYTPAIASVANATFGVGTNLTYDAFRRQIYMQSDAVLQQQANVLLKSGHFTEAEVRALSAQRNVLRTTMQNKVSPFGRLYSRIIEINKTFDQRLLEKGSLEAVLESLGKSRAVVNRMVVRMRMAGRGSIVVQLAFSAYIVIEARPEDRARVISRQAGALVGGTVGGWAGAWAGCATGAMLASPTFVIPAVNVATGGTACLVGGLIGGLGFGALGSLAGEAAGGGAYDYVTRLRWIRQ